MRQWPCNFPYNSLGKRYISIKEEEAGGTVEGGVWLGKPRDAGAQTYLQAVCQEHSTQLPGAQAVSGTVRAQPAVSWEPHFPCTLPQLYF